MTQSLPRLAAPALLLVLAACAGSPQQGEFLSSYEGLTPRTDMVRAGALDRTDTAALAAVSAVRIEPTVFDPPGRGPGLDDPRRADRHSARGRRPALL